MGGGWGCSVTVLLLMLTKISVIQTSARICIYVNETVTSLKLRQPLGSSFLFLLVPSGLIQNPRIECVTSQPTPFSEIWRWENFIFANFSLWICAKSYLPDITLWNVSSFQNKYDMSRMCVVMEETITLMRSEPFAIVLKIGEGLQTFRTFC